MPSSMTSSMTSHATIGNSTFARPRSSDTTMSSIDGPSDFTANMIDYMKGGKAPTSQKSSYVRTKVNLKPKHHLDPDQSGVVIESPSEFSDDTVDYLAHNKTMSSPARNDQSDLDGPSDFTDNLMAYMKGHKASPPSLTTSSQFVASKAVREPTLAKALLQSLVRKTSKESITGRASPQSSASQTTKPIKPITTAKASPQSFASKAIKESTTTETSPQSLASKATKIPTTAQASRQQVIGTKVDQLVPPTKTPLQQTSGAKEATQPISPLISLEQAVNRRETESPLYREQNATASASKAPSQPMTDANCLLKLHKNLVINGPPDFTTSITAFINSGTAVNPHATDTISQPKCTIRPMSSPAKGQHFDTGGLPDFKASLGDYINGAKKDPVRATRSPVDDQESTKPPAVAKTYTSQSKTSSPPTNAAADMTGGMINKAASNAQEEELRQQIAKLQAQLQQKDDTILELQTRAITAEERCGKMELELESKYTTIHRLRTSLEASNEQCRESETEIDEVKAEWQARAQLLMKEVDRRGAACMQLWGQLENPGQTDGEGRQKYTYKYTKKSTRGGPVV